MPLLDQRETEGCGRCARKGWPRSFLQFISDGGESKAERLAGRKHERARPEASALAHSAESRREMLAKAASPCAGGNGRRQRSRRLAQKLSPSRIAKAAFIKLPGGFRAKA